LRPARWPEHCTVFLPESGPRQPIPLRPLRSASPTDKLVGIECSGKSDGIGGAYVAVHVARRTATKRIGATSSAVVSFERGTPPVGRPSPEPGSPFPTRAPQLTLRLPALRLPRVDEPLSQRIAALDEHPTVTLVAGSRAVAPTAESSQCGTGAWESVLRVDGDVGEIRDSYIKQVRQIGFTGEGRRDSFDDGDWHVEIAELWAAGGGTYGVESVTTKSATYLRIYRCND
ncbi:MAG: hypothetical protein LC640_06150, partial [Frankia sp.]|nr:hypothetical protein [Frankia sp.]